RRRITKRTGFEGMTKDRIGGSRTIKASEFKAKCLKLMDEVAASGKEVVITKNGRPVSRLVPYREKPKSLFGIDRGRIELLGDIIEPLDVEWEAETGKTWDGAR
ncbi:MAG: type II toxin-antitoxin system prevent-host-death family antitoxin, partial [Desulfurellaceae bacterium]|nr:type II toxin-antitoxin system prevent-host-death family antitoxin [Desulfurellaceae bacterium]